METNDTLSEDLILKFLPIGLIVKTEGDWANSFSIVLTEQSVNIRTLSINCLIAIATLGPALTKCRLIVNLF